uniref:Uncharacterized protein n=1 Tax=Vibrio splendidus TaxID=29497 RepID=A0A0H3ZW43_VIBSP|nr:hypothetical protein [Vibrio splendidus]
MAKAKLRIFITLKTDKRSPFANQRLRPSDNRSGQPEHGQCQGVNQSENTHENAHLAFIGSLVQCPEPGLYRRIERFGGARACHDALPSCAKWE